MISIIVRLRGLLGPPLERVAFFRTSVMREWSLSLLNVARDVALRCAEKEIWRMLLLLLLVLGVAIGTTLAYRPDLPH